jgi:hypothetical protein
VERPARTKSALLILLRLGRASGLHPRSVPPEKAAARARGCRWHSSASRKRSGQKVLGGSAILRVKVHFCDIHRNNCSA